MSVWTDRTVRFTPFPKDVHGERWDTFFELLPQHYWERPGWVRRFLEPAIGSCEGVVSVSGLPWWMPKWWARRTVARLAYACGLGGDAEYVIERAVLPDA